MTNPLISNKSAICGGVINQTEFYKDPTKYMMWFILPDEIFKRYLKANDKERKQIFNKYAYSII